MDSKRIDLRRGRLLSGGTMRIELSPASLFGDRDDHDYNVKASALRFAEILIRELQARHPNMHIKVMIGFGDEPLKIDGDLIPDSDRAMKDAIRIATDLEKPVNEHKWLVEIDSAAERIIVKRYEEQTTGEAVQTVVSNLHA